MRFINAVVGAHDFTLSNRQCLDDTICGFLDIATECKFTWLHCIFSIDKQDRIDLTRIDTGTAFPKIISTRTSLNQETVEAC